MATLKLTGGAEKFTWRIMDLANPFKSSNYIRAGITSYPFTGSGVSSIGGIQDYEEAPLSNYSYGTDQWTIDWSAGDYTFWGFAQAANRLYYASGTASVTVSSSTSRPSDFFWEDMREGSPMIKATEWNKFTSKINEFNEYLTRPRYSFITAYPNDVFTATMFNQARSQINILTNKVVVGQKYVGDKLYASDFNRLQDALNSL